MFKDMFSKIMLMFAGIKELQTIERFTRLRDIKTALYLGEDILTEEQVKEIKIKMIENL